MPTTLPIILRAGLFQSKDWFSELADTSDNAITKLRTAKRYELELFVKDGGISHLNGNSYPIKKGCLLIAQPGDKRQSTLHFSTVCVHFKTSDEKLQNLLHSISGFHPTTDYKKLLPLLNDICETTLTFEPDSDILAAAKLISFLCEIKKQRLEAPLTDPDSSAGTVVSTAIKYMKQNYMEPLTVQQVADHCCFSSSHFHKLFLETVHTTPNNYLTQIRLAAAKSLLSTTTMPISEIAFKCGFNSQAYFSDCFKRNFSISPKDFRRSYVHPDMR